MNRRILLKKVGASAIAGTAGLSNVASANDKSVDGRTVRQVLSGHTDLLRDLSAAGVLDHPGLGQFEFDAYAGPGAASEGVAETTSRNFAGTRTTTVYSVNRETDDGFVTIRVRPELDFASATHRTDDGEVTVYGASVPDDGDVSVQCHGGCDDPCLIERCDDCAGDTCDNCCWCEPTCTTGCYC
jgi:hypothetical protein